MVIGGVFGGGGADEARLVVVLDDLPIGGLFGGQGFFGGRGFARLEGGEGLLAPQGGHSTTPLLQKK